MADISRDELVERLAAVSHGSWRRQKHRDQGVPLDELGLEATDHDRERAQDSVAELERLGLYPTAPRHGAARLRAKWGAGEPTFGLWAAIPTSMTTELAASVGYDYVCVDLQHGLSDEWTMVSMLRAAERSAPLVRVAWNEPGLIMRALDLGAAGVIVPLVSSRAEAARAVEACRYPPDGTRSFGPSRAELVIGTSVPAELGAAALCFVMIETREGLEAVEEIAATPGLDGLYIGPSDLSLALGLTPRVGGPLLERAIARVLEAAHAHGLIAGMHCASGQDARARAEQGFELITAAVDASLFRAAITRELGDARG